MDFDKARFNMVEQQIRPWDVLDFDVLDALMEIPREAFVGADLQGLVYADVELPLPNGAKMLEPKVVARLVQGLKLAKTDTVLEIGTGSGYAAALLAKLAGQVVTVDSDPVQQAQAKHILSGLGFENIIYARHDGLKQASEHAPFDAIYVGGAVREISETLKQQLTNGGRMVVMQGNDTLQRALLMTRDGDVFNEKVLFDTCAAWLDEGGSKPYGGFDF